MFPAFWLASGHSTLWKKQWCDCPHFVSYWEYNPYEYILECHCVKIIPMTQFFPLKNSLGWNVRNLYFLGLFEFFLKSILCIVNTHKRRILGFFFAVFSAETTCQSITSICDRTWESHWSCHFYGKLERFAFASVTFRISTTKNRLLLQKE